MNAIRKNCELVFQVYINDMYHFSLAVAISPNIAKNAYLLLQYLPETHIAIINLHINLHILYTCQLIEKHKYVMSRARILELKH